MISRSAICTKADLAFASFLFSCFIFLPFPYYLFNGQQTVANFLFGWLMQSLDAIAGYTSSAIRFQSDSRWQYWLAGVLLLLSYMSFLLPGLSGWFQKKGQRFQNYIRRGLYFFLALHLVKYGVDKIFLNQFYTPEPNILFTPYGNLDKDMLYWSTMGLAPGYSVFLGLTEVAAAVLLIFKNTRKFALVLAIGILVNVLAINIAFDIAVKLHAAILLATAVWLFLHLKQNESLRLHSPFGYYLRWFAISLILVETCLPFMANTNDIKYPFAGAYTIAQTKQAKRFKRFFIHKDGYFILQDASDRFIDWQLQIEEDKKRMKLIDYNKKEIWVRVEINNKHELVELFLPVGNDTIQIIPQRIQTVSMPAMQRKIQLTVDVDD